MGGLSLMALMGGCYFQYPNYKNVPSRRDEEEENDEQQQQPAEKPSSASTGTGRRINGGGICEKKNKIEKRKKKKNTSTSKLAHKQCYDYESDSNGGDEKSRSCCRIEEKDHDLGSKEGGTSMVRIKVVLTQEELKQLLEYNNYKASNNSYRCGRNSRDVQQLCLRLTELKMKKNSKNKRRNFSTVQGKWRPALESIPEDQYH